MFVAQSEYSSSTSQKHERKSERTEECVGMSKSEREQEEEREKVKRGREREKRPFSLISPLELWGQECIHFVTTETRGRGESTGMGSLDQ